MKERPILFSTPMVRALLDGSKTQTRRVVKPDPGPYWNPQVGLYNPIAIENGGYEAPGPEVYGASDELQGRKFPYGQPGDRLWVREEFALSVVDPDGGSPEDEPENWDVIYRADPDQPGGRWTDGEGNAIKAPWQRDKEMPRWASRILLEIVSVRVERLQDIGSEEIEAEGVVTSDAAIMEHGCRARVIDFTNLWESIYGAGSWDANPWVWVVEFKRVTP